MVAVIRKKLKLPPKNTIIKAARSQWISFILHIKKSDNPEYSTKTFGELCSVLSPIWRTMTNEQKQPFVLESRIDRDRYNHELSQLGDLDRKLLRAHRRASKKRRLGAPKAPLSAYMVFVSTERMNVISDNPNITFPDIGRELGHRWHSLNKIDKLPFETRSNQYRLEYHELMKGWNLKRVKPVVMNE